MTVKKRVPNNVILIFVFQLKTIAIVFIPYFLSSSRSKESDKLGSIREMKVHCEKAKKRPKVSTLPTAAHVPIKSANAVPPLVTSVLTTNILFNLICG